MATKTTAKKKATKTTKKTATTSLALTDITDVTEATKKDATEVKTSAKKTKTQETNYVIKPNKDVYKSEPFSYLKAKSTVNQDPYAANQVQVYGGRDYAKQYRERPIVTAYGIDEHGDVTVEFEGREIKFGSGSLDPLYVALTELMKAHRVNSPEPLTATKKAKKTTKK
jgi:hypothetical protein